MYSKPLRFNRAGREIGVASTKAFTAQVTVLTMIALVVAQRKGVISELIDEDIPVVIIATKDGSYGKIVSNIEEVKMLRPGHGHYYWR